nr:hypothetical protein [Ammoniphilus sp. CFH 90114]
MGLALDEPMEEDKVETINEIVVAIDNKIIEYTEELSLDDQNGGLVMLGNQGCC